jgi:hypothetical protein
MYTIAGATQMPLLIHASPTRFDPHKIVDHKFEYYDITVFFDR